MYQTGLGASLVFRTDRAFASKTRVLRSDRTVEANRILMGPLSDQDRMSRRLHLADDSGPLGMTGHYAAISPRGTGRYVASSFNAQALQCIYLLAPLARTVMTDRSSSLTIDRIEPQSSEALARTSILLFVCFARLHTIRPRILYSGAWPALCSRQSCF